MRRTQSTNCTPFLVLLLALLCCAHIARAAEVIPPSPSPRYVTDQSHILSASVANDLNTQLENFERDTSNQVLVAIYPHMQSDSDIADYTTRVAQSWRAGTKKKSNGAVLFIFSDDRKMQIAIGYGLEGALPDATCKQIIDDEIAPYFKKNDYDTGVQNGVKAIMAAAKGEYKGTGRTANEAQHPQNFGSSSCFGIFIFIAIFAFLIFARRSGWARSASYGGMILGGGGWSSGRGGWSSGGGGWSSGGGGGGFSGGGGSFGGGGAGGSW